MRYRIGFSPLLAVVALGCSGGDTTPDLGPSTFEIEITSVNGNTTLPTAEMPLPANRGDKVETWTFNIEARKSTGALEKFNGYVRLSVRPGTLYTVTGVGASGRNILLKDGKASGSVDVTAVYGPSRLWAQDLGYTPAEAGKKPACANGKDDDGNGLVDHPADPGCAFADDDDERGASFAAGVSPPVEYALPKVSDVRGTGAATPYPFEAIEINTGAPQHVVVTRVASDGFYVSDMGAAEIPREATTCTQNMDCASNMCMSGLCACATDADCTKGGRCVDGLCPTTGGYNSLFAFNFSTPPGMRVCDVLTYLSGTANDFFGFTELSFPSFKVTFPLEGQGSCEVPEPVVLDAKIINDPVAMQRLQSSLVRIQNFKIASRFGPGIVKNNVFTPEASNCDFNGDGQIDYAGAEGECASICDKADGDCSEWTAFSARGDYNMILGNAIIKVQTGTVAGFDPTAYRGQVLGSVTGTMRKFSGGNLNWTIETRCPDDLACGLPGCGASAPVSSQTACVRLRTLDDNDQGTN